MQLAVACQAAARLPICLCVGAPEQWGSGALQCPLSWQLSDESPMSCRSPEQEKRTVEPEVNFSPLMVACGGAPGWPQSTSVWQGDKWENKVGVPLRTILFPPQVRRRIRPYFSIAEDARVRAFAALLMREESGLSARVDVPHLLHYFTRHNACLSALLLLLLLNQLGLMTQRKVP